MASSEAAHHYHFDIAMSCSGCSGAVDRVLKKTDGMLPVFISRDLCVELCVGMSLALEMALEMSLEMARRVEA